MRLSPSLVVFLGIFGLSLVVLFAFVNCQTNDNGGSFLNASNNSALLTNGSADVALRFKVNPPQMECTADHIDVGGICETNGAEDNYIEYTLTRDKNPVTWNAGGAAISILRESRCDNGRFFMTIPRPSDAINIPASDPTRCIPPDCSNVYQLNARLFGRAPGSNQFTLLSTADALNFSIQLIVVDSAGNVTCPN